MKKLVMRIPTDVANSLPDEWFEDRGIDIQDKVVAVFLNNNLAMLALFWRTAPRITAPMAVDRRGITRVIIACSVSGFFQKTVNLTLQDKNNERLSLSIPLSSLAKEYHGTAAEFLKGAESVGGVYATMWLPAFMFASNTQIAS